MVVTNQVPRLGFWSVRSSSKLRPRVKTHSCTPIAIAEAKDKKSIANRTSLTKTDYSYLYNKAWKPP